MGWWSVFCCFFLWFKVKIFSIFVHTKKIKSKIHSLSEHWSMYYEKTYLSYIIFVEFYMQNRNDICISTLTSIYSLFWGAGLTATSRLLLRIEVFSPEEFVLMQSVAWSQQPIALSAWGIILISHSNKVWILLKLWEV